jgi:hypothetical protein
MDLLEAKKEFNLFAKHRSNFLKENKMAIGVDALDYSKIKFTLIDFILIDKEYKLLFKNSLY